MSLRFAVSVLAVGCWLLAVNCLLLTRSCCFSLPAFGDLLEVGGDGVFVDGVVAGDYG